MSWNPCLDPICPDSVEAEAIETIIIPRARDLGGFEVRRALPAPKRQLVGPFIFFDQMGPAEFLTGQGIDVRPHPHIGLATVTYLYQGHFQHRDSLGFDLEIQPGALNWMVAGDGVTHSERSSARSRRSPQPLFGVQTWVALPQKDEERPASFEHFEKDTLPTFEDNGLFARLILGRAFGRNAPAKVFSDMFYLDVALEPDAQIPLPDDQEDRGVYVISGSVEIAGRTFEAGRMLVFRPGDRLAVRGGPQGARMLLLGGATMDGPRYVWWNFVASSKDKIEAAKESWRAGDFTHGRFKLPPRDDYEFSPAPAD